MNNLDNFVKLSDNEQLSLLKQWHYQMKMSVPDIAKDMGTYPNKVRRIGNKLGFKFRNRSEQQSVAIQTGKVQHPTKGKKRSAAIIQKISRAKGQNWKEMTDSQRQEISEKHKENWKNLSDAQKQNLQNLATKARLKAAKDGSKLEHKIKTYLISKGIVVDFHKEHLLVNERIHLDIYLPDLNTAIEIDGPSHFLPIWGEEKLKKIQQTDSMKDGLLLTAGLCIIRLRQEKNLSTFYIDELINKLDIELLKIQKKFPPIGKRRINI